ncbi:MAG TPA: serine/threonine-protein kinase [Kofleriaceae bacterium]
MKRVSSDLQEALAETSAPDPAQLPTAAATKPDAPTALRAEAEGTGPTVAAQPEATGPTVAAKADDIASSDTVATRAATTLLDAAHPPKRIGRYVVKSTLGRGGMGVVYRATDPDLKRPVAIKVLHDRLLAGQILRQRFLQEAQAMASLTHPNIVQVFDVGSDDGRIFIAMEFIAGTTLREWMADEHSWREVRDTFMRAGQGVAAAHARGIIHRDFKPDNVLMSDDGRVCVSDFGLARSLGEVETGARPARDTSANLLPPSTLTSTGEVMGTPAYMAPEQHHGDATDGRTDQFSFCVALYEALYGERPYQGKSMIELAVAVDAGVIAPPTRTRGVPSWLRAVVLRGLRPTPDERYPSMKELLAALSRDPGRTARRVGLAVGLVGLTLGASYFAFTEDTRDPCADAGAPLTKVWSPSRAETIAAAFRKTDVAYAPAAADRARARVDAYASAWRGQRTQSCKATQARQQSQDLLDRRTLCLDRRLAALDATLATLERATPATVQNAVRTVSELPDLAACENAEQLLALVPPPAATQRAELAELQRQLAALASRSPDKGDFEPLLAEAEHVLAAATNLGYAPFIAEVQHAYAELAIDAQRFDRARKLLDDALANASRGRDDRGVAEAWIRRFEIEADHAAKGEAIATVEEAAKAAVLRAGDGGLTGSLQMAIGRQRFKGDRIPEAGEAFEAARAAFVAAYGYTDLRSSRALHNLALVRRENADLPGAKQLLEQSIAQQRTILGPEHPQIQQAESVLSTVLRDLGDTAGAIALATRSLEVREKLYGPKHDEVAASLSALGGVEYITGDYAKALEHYKRSIDIYAAVRGADHKETGGARKNVGMTLTALGRGDEAKVELEEALRVAKKHNDQASIADVLNDLASAVAPKDRPASIDYTRRAIEMRIKLYGPSHPLVASSQINLALDLIEERQYDEAETNLRAALATWEAKLGKTHPRLAYPLIGLGKIALARKQGASAVPSLERAVKLVAEASVDVMLRAEAKFVLGKALWQSGDRKRATKLAGEALEALGKEAGVDELRAEIAAWQKRPT